MISIFNDLVQCVSLIFLVPSSATVAPVLHDGTRGTKGSSKA